MNSYELGFYAASAIAAPFWLAMMFAPNSALTRRVMRSLWPVFLLAIPYTMMELPHYLSDLPSFLRPRLSIITELLSKSDDVAIAWVHFVAVDFFAGRWVYLDSQSRGYSPWLIAPILFVCLMFCPAGLAIYLLARACLKASPAAIPETAQP